MGKVKNVAVKFETNENFSKIIQDEGLSNIEVARDLKTFLLKRIKNINTDTLTVTIEDKPETQKEN